MVSFGDNVRIRRTPETEATGVAGLEGQVYGETTPSVTDVDVIGHLQDDYALNVHFENHEGEWWFTTDLVEFIDHAVGSEIRLNGIDKRWVRTADGGWAEESTDATATKPWWKFW